VSEVVTTAPEKLLAAGLESSCAKIFDRFRVESLELGWNDAYCPGSMEDHSRQVPVTTWALHIPILKGEVRLLDSRPSRGYLDGVQAETRISPPELILTAATTGSGTATGVEAEWNRQKKRVAEYIHTFRRLGQEERIRDLLLVVLNASYEGHAGAEVFNFAGKTDLLIKW
jgi:hypothetical protein